MNMMRVVDRRGTGKTTQLILYAIAKKAVLVVPSYRHKTYIRDMMDRFGLDPKKLDVATLNEVFSGKWKDRELVVDELDLLLRGLEKTVGNIIGYSISLEGARFE